MSQPIVFISRSRIVGNRRAFAAAFAALVPEIESTKPGTAAFAAYVDAAKGEVAVVHVFLDPAAMTAHFEGSDARSAAAADFIALVGFEVYGPAPSSAIDQLRREAARAGIPFDTFPGSLGGFIRSPE